MDGSKWIIVALGVLGLVMVISTILNFQDGLARERGGKVILRAEQQRAFWLAVALELTVGTVFVAVAVAVIFFNLK
jgi:uncharacterized membrane protein YidH (DUF202 family)